MLAGGRPRFRTDVHHVLGYDVVHVEETAVKVWEPKFLAEIVARRDPRIPPDVPRAAIGVTVAEFLDTYSANHVEAEPTRRTAG